MNKLLLITILMFSALHADTATDAMKGVKKEAAKSMTDSLKGEATKQAKEVATDIAAEQVEGAVGKETVTKETAKSVIKSVI